MLLFIIREVHFLLIFILSLFMVNVFVTDVIKWECFIAKLIESEGETVL